MFHFSRDKSRFSRDESRFSQDASRFSRVHWKYQCFVFWWYKMPIFKPFFYVKTCFVYRIKGWFAQFKRLAWETQFLFWSTMRVPVYHKISSILQYCFIYIGQTFAIITIINIFHTKRFSDSRKKRETRRVSWETRQEVVTYFWVVL